jgi:hypothetical protein
MAALSRSPSLRCHIGVNSAWRGDSIAAIILNPPLASPV